jgi:hypothetical protein
MGDVETPSLDILSTGLTVSRLRRGRTAEQPEEEPINHFGQIHCRHQSEASDPKEDGEAIAPIGPLSPFRFPRWRFRSGYCARLDSGNRRGEECGLCTHKRSPPYQMDH